MRGQDNIAGLELSPGCLYDAWFAFDDVQRPGAFEDVAAIAIDRLRQRKKILSRVELKLVVKADGPVTVEWQWRPVDVGYRKPEAPDRLELVLQLFDTIRAGRVFVLCRPGEIAVYIVLFRQAGNRLYRCLAGRGALTRFLLPVYTDEVLVVERLRRGSERRRISGHPFHDLSCFDQRDFQPSLLQHKCRGDPGDPLPRGQPRRLSGCFQCRIISIRRRRYPVWLCPAGNAMLVEPHTSFHHFDTPSRRIIIIIQFYKKARI